MTTASNSWSDEQGRLPRQLQMQGRVLGHRRARRLCQRFARVGVITPPDRLQAMLAGAPVAASEVTDVNFALIATQFNRAERVAKLKRLQRQATRSLMFAGLVLVALHFLFCMAYLLVNLTQQASP